MKGWRQTAAASTLVSLRVLAHPSRHRRGSKMKVSGLEGGGEGGARTVGRDESRVVVEVSLAQHSCFHPSTLTTPTPPSPPKNTLFLLAALFHPIIPLLLHCICFLIRSVWEAHEPFLQPLHRHHLHLLFLLLLHSPFSRVAVMLLVFLCVAPVISSVIPPSPPSSFFKVF